MNSQNNQVPMNTLADVLGSVRKKGVRLWSENNQLHYNAPKGSITPEEIERLRALRDQIIALLEKAKAAETAEPKVEHHRQIDRAPLTFSQFNYWHTYKLYEGRSTRPVAFAMRVRGRLDIDAFRKSVAENVRRHDALRTRIVVCDGVPVQDIDDSSSSELELDDVTAVSEHLRDAEINRQIENLVLEPIDIGIGPLFGVRLVKVRDDDHVLIMVMDHMISDGYSLNILARDLFSGYVQVLKGQSFLMPVIPMQFAEYAVWQQSMLKAWIKEHGAYWTERLEGCQRLRFPEDRRSSGENHLGWGHVPFRIDQSLKEELIEWSRLRQTTLVMSVFTAYVGLVLRWCNASESVIQYQSDARSSPNVENTIGFFASILYLRIALLENDTFVDLNNKVTDEYCRAYEHADFSYIAAQLPRPEFTRNTTFNWVPQGALKIDLADLAGSEDALICSPVRFAYPTIKTLQLDSEPVIQLSEADDEILGDMCFPLNRFSDKEMERFSRNLLVFIRALLRNPEGYVKDISLV